jgi:polyisoprenoid-binding protein YceI
MRRSVTVIAFAILAACGRHEPVAETPVSAAVNVQPEAGEPSAAAAMATDIPAGAYTLDKAHTSLLFKVSHLGFSRYTARFRKLDAKLQFDPANLAATQLTATVDARSIETDFPDPATVDFNAQLQGAEWLNAAQFPQIEFRTTRVEPKGKHGMTVHGELTMRGVTRPIVLDATYNGGYSGHPLDPHARIGFSAQGALRRSEFGISGGIPEAGSNVGVGDKVTIVIESEFNGPPQAKAQAAPTT